MVNDRKHSARRALHSLGQDRFVAFIRAVRREQSPYAVMMMNEALDSGEDAEETLLAGDEYGYNLYVRRVGPRRYRIDFGFLAGPTAGDGGEWEVQYDGEKRVVSAESDSFWIS